MSVRTDADVAAGWLARADDLESEARSLRDAARNLVGGIDTQSAVHEPRDSTNG